MAFGSYRKKLIKVTRERIEKETLSKEILGEVKRHSVDIYPWGTAYILANNLNWKPRPVFQSYAAYTPWLDEANYNFFKSNNSPSYIIWITKGTDIARLPTGSIDERYLLNDEPKTIHKILDSYEPLFYEEKAVLLKRKEAPTFSRPNELPGEIHTFDKWIGVPILRNGVVKAKIEFRRALSGKIKRLLYKEKEVFIEYKLKGGSIIKHRLVVDNAISGIWVHPYMTDVPPALKSRDATGKRGKAVSHIKISCQEKENFEPHFIVNWVEYIILQ